MSKFDKYVLRQRRNSLLIVSKCVIHVLHESSYHRKKHFCHKQNVNGDFCCTL